MEPTPGSFVRPVDPAPELQSDEFLWLQGAAESVFDVAIGSEYEVSESLSILGGIRNDMSYFNKYLNEEAEIS